MMIRLYTDGSVTAPRDRISSGGWAFCYEHKNTFYKGSGCVHNATNNQMEIMGAIKGIRHLLKNKFESQPICVISDSQYVIHGVTMWLDGWKRNGWRNSQHKELKNKEYWQELDELAAKINARWKWVRGHVGNEGNEFCDKAARSAAFRLGGLVMASKEQLEYD